MLKRYFHRKVEEDPVTQDHGSQIVRNEVVEDDTPIIFNHLIPYNLTPDQNSTSSILTVAFTKQQQWLV